VQHKKYTVELLAEMGKSLKSSGRVLIMHISDNPFVHLHIGESKLWGFEFSVKYSSPVEHFAEVMPYVDYFILESNSLVTHANSRTGFNFNLKLTVSCFYFQFSF
jgi:hypothetical protein